MSKAITIRTDMGGNFGMGHAVRSLALAQQLQSHGAYVTFLTSTAPLEDFVAPFPCDTKSNECLPLEADVFIVDTTDGWIQSVLEALRAGEGTNTKVMRIDHPHATASSCHLLVAPVNHWSPERVHYFQTTLGERFLYGWDYVMLTPEVTQMAPMPYSARQGMDGITFCAGGTDPAGILAQMYAWASVGMDIDVPLYFPMLGKTEAYRDALRTSAFVVGMMGVTVYEALWYKTPMLVFSRSEEESKDVCTLQFQSNHQIYAAGQYAHWNGPAFCNLVTALYLATKQRVLETASFIDGRGLNRVAEAILAL